MEQEHPWLRSRVRRADDHGLAVALRRRVASLIAEWDSRVRAYLAATSGRDEAKVDAGFGDDGLCHFEPEAEAVVDEVLLCRVAFRCLRWNFGDVDASTALQPLPSADVSVTTPEGASHGETGQEADHRDEDTVQPAVRFLLRRRPRPPSLATSQPATCPLPLSTSGHLLSKGKMEHPWLRSSVWRADDNGLAVALRRRAASLIAEWDSRVRAYLAATSGRDEAKVDAGFGDDDLCHFEPEAEDVVDEVLLCRVACRCLGRRRRASGAVVSVTTPEGASHGEGSTTGLGTGHGDDVGVTTPEGTGHDDGVTTAQGARDEEGEYGPSDIFLTQRRSGYGYYLDALKHWVLVKLGLTDLNDDIPLKWSWVNMMGAPIYQSKQTSLGDSADGSCVICACMTCIHAQHRLAFERRHGAGSFPYELCQTTGVRAIKFFCVLFRVWEPHIMEANNSMPAHEFVGAQSSMDINGPRSNNDGFSTPRKTTSIPLRCSSFTPECEEELKTVVGMVFNDMDSVEKFYKSYAHHVGFGVRVGQHKKLVDDVVMWKRFLCDRQGFKLKKSTNSTNSSQKATMTSNTSKKNSKKRKRKETRCGCDAHIFVKRTSDNKYMIASLVEHHNHGLVTPSKHHLIRSNRRVNEKAKQTLYSCHKASIGTSQAFRFEGVGCTKRDLQNYYCEFKNKINDCDAQMFVDQLGRMKELNPAFFFDYDVDENGRLLHVFWEDATARKNYNHFGDVVSFDSTYTRNHYNMIFAPFTRVNHHMQSVFFGAGFVVNERIASRWESIVMCRALKW
ncbi:hypothetical protein ACQ4PT_070032 [Festuca glaucescens]